MIRWYLSIQVCKVLTLTVNSLAVATEHVGILQTFSSMDRRVSQQESLLAYTSTAVVHGCNILAVLNS